MKLICCIAVSIWAVICLSGELSAGKGYRHGKRSSHESGKIADAYNKHLERKLKGDIAPTTMEPTTMEFDIFCPFNSNINCDASTKYRSFDGTCNNLDHPLYGSANTPYKRFLAPKYDDGFNSPKTLAANNGILPSPRQISATIMNDDFQSEARFSHFFTIFGQFITHDMTSLASTTCNFITASYIKLPLILNTV